MEDLWEAAFDYDFPSSSGRGLRSFLEQMMCVIHLQGLWETYDPH